MSREIRPLNRTPMIALVEKAAHGLGVDMVRTAHAHGFTEVRLAHDAVFGTLPGEGARITDMAARAGITKQSMGEVVRELVELGICRMEPDPSDRRAKIVTYTDYGREVTDARVPSTSSRWSVGWRAPSARTTRPRAASWSG